MHDIGIHQAEARYGSSNGKYQEELGPAEARNLLEQLHVAETDIDRVCYLVGHHHTYSHIDGLDYQILVEADFLVNLYEDQDLGTWRGLGVGAYLQDQDWHAVVPVDV